MKELPLEIWLYIATFIPEATLRELLGVNLLFYNISLDMRYKSITLQRFSSRTMKLLKRLACVMFEMNNSCLICSLSSDPAIGERVRLLTASPDFRFYGAVRAPPTSSLRKFLHPFRLLGFGSDNLNKPRPEEEGTRALTDALPAMSNVMAFTIDSHSWGQHPGTQLHQFLNTAWVSFGFKLKKLSLRGHAASFRTIITSKPLLPMVEELFFELIDNPTSDMRQEDADTLVTVFAPFINSFSSRLQALTFWAWTSLELSAFFWSLGNFPLLTCFNFQTSFPRTFRDDPSSLSAFLRQHHTRLEILVLRLNKSPLLHAIQTEQPLSEWMLSTFQANHFSHLEELQLYPSALPRGFDALLTCIQLSAETLHTLVVRDRYLDPQDVLRLVYVLPSNIQYLQLNVLEMDVQLYDSLAYRLPRLLSLSLYISKVLPDFTTFLSEMKIRTYTDWRLRNIGVWQNGSMGPYKLMHALANSIPSVDSFWGDGNTNMDMTM